MFGTTLRSLFQAHPYPPSGDPHALAEVLETLALCEQVCRIGADACLAEKSPEKLRTCIRLDLECAEICSTTARLLLHPADSAASALSDQLQACQVACQACADLCASHGAQHEHCALCADTCSRCQEKCTAMLEELAAASLAAID